jgi:hypothetical protein
MIAHAADTGVHAGPSGGLRAPAGRPAPNDGGPVTDDAVPARPDAPAAPAPTVPASAAPAAPAPGAPPADRYGRPPSPARRRAARVGLGVLAAAGVGVVVWLGLGAASTPVRWDEVGYRVDGATAVELTFDVTKDEDATAVCRVQALSARHAEVGVQSVTIGPAGTRTQRVTTTIPTAEEAVTAVVHSCDPA